MTLKRSLSIFASLFLMFTLSAKAEMGIGVTGAYHMLGGDGSETVRQSGAVNNGEIDENVIIPEVFVEAVGDNGFTLGLSYIPTRELGKKTRTDTSAATGQESGTYTAEAELDNVFQIYSDIPMTDTVYLKLGIQHVTVSTLESLNSGSSYPNDDLLGYTAGFGTKGDLPYGNNLYYKAEVTYTNFETYEKTSAGNKITADLDDVAAKFSIGYKF